MKKTVLTIIMAVIITASYAQEKRYGIERAIVKATTTTAMPGMQQTVSSIQYFDEFGSKESAESFMTTGGQVVSMFTMMKDGYSYNANVMTGQGIKTKLPSAADNYQMVNYLNLTNEVKSQYKIEEKGNERILGRDCKVYQMTVPVQGQIVEATVSVWQGIPLKLSMSILGINIVQEATEIQEGATIPREKFELPAGVNFVEMN